MVTINDAATPTISNATQEFCEFDDSTVADLTDAVNETGNITWYDSADGDNALNRRNTTSRWFSILCYSV